ALSGGQRQRVALGRAIVREPLVFLMDEPLSNLDAKLRVQMRSEISKLHHRLQTTFIYVTHDQTEALTMGTRIVVMKDGIIQQVDSPQVLYNYPANMFVAGFIGSPQMNFTDAVIVEENQSIYVKMGSNKIKLTAEKAAKAKEYVGQTVVVGIRPEDLYDDQDSIAKFSETVISADVEVTELMGAETYLYVTVDGINLIARVKPDTTATVGSNVKLAIDPVRVHLFDKETEKTITN
ncbi:MAG: TOBE domain-containing protein, partial [Clostridia bacterium]|nr:TOBE domain-containing protein [Clostridia bacterium]